MSTVNQNLSGTQVPTQRSIPGAKYAKIYRSLGISQIILGTLSVFFAIAAFLINNSASSYMVEVGSGIWCGFFFLLAGGISMQAATKPHSCKIIGGMVSCIFAALFASVLTIISIVYALQYDTQYMYYNNYSSSGKNEAAVAFHALLAITGFIELVLSIVHSSFFCAASCCATCTKNTSNNQVMMVQVPNTGQTMYLQQPIAYAYPPVQGQYPAYTYTAVNQSMQPVPITAPAPAPATALAPVPNQVKS
ncbi:membrane-spanning 4-domains subfamily A member 8 isoform X2 [Ciona intestinalis]